ncbi:hypothetical protein GMA12_02180 [Kocuria sediminis]|uniref:Uncharacterized protein n=1 Tax=Kocuria sediminis TaxID=1038857 RepID=A0A6N8GL43_9MICC|nr:hypothetical protein [Kocuria sediminis]MUN61963.1 hypothetical protein [Kocuria sediminis]
MFLTHENGPRTGPARRPEPSGRPVRSSPATLQALQRSAGNAAAAAYVQRLAESPGPVKTVPASPQNDPRFQAVAAKVAGQGRQLRQHPAPRAEARQAAKAAVPPATDKEAQAKAAQAETMTTARPGGFDKAGFIAAVKAAIAAQAPKNLEQAEKFGESGKAEAVKAQVAGKVTEGKKASAQDIAEKTAAAPDTSKVEDKPVAPLPAGPQPAAPRVDAAAAMPAPVPTEQVDLGGGKRETDEAMAQADVTEQQLATSNEPEFTGALAAKKQGEEHSATAPAAFREAEAAQLGAARQEAQQKGASGLAGMLGAKKSALSKAVAGKTAAKSQDETERAKIAGEIKAIFDATKAEVTAILGALDGEVDKEFSTGEAEVRKAFTADLNARLAEYKRKRYSGWGGSLLWAKDLLADLPEEANQCYVAARKTYEEGMSRVIGKVADLIGDRLTRAKERIAKGRADIKAYVAAKPRNLQKVAQQAAEQFSEQFDQLENDVDAKKDALVEDLAAKYTESKAAVDAEVTAMQEANKGAWSKAKEAVGGAIQTILQLKDLLASVLARAANAVGRIIKDPIGFLGNFVKAVKGGILRFGENIVEHLKAGLQGWLLGSLSAAGIELPAKLDLKGIVGLVLSLLGLTWPAIRARIAKHVPEQVMAGVEKSVAFIQVILTEGVSGLWKWVVEKLGDIKEMVMDQIRDFVITRIVKAGITWLISMLNPAAAFIKACKMIYDVVMFFVERAAQIKEFVDSVLDSVESIASGGVGAVAGYIEMTLSKMVPVLIGFLASLLGLGGISDKIKEIIARVQEPVGKVVDKLIAGAVKIGKKLLKKLSGAFQKGKAWVKAKYEKGKAYVKKKLGIKDETLSQKQHRLEAGVAAGIRAVDKYAGKAVAGKILKPLLLGIRLRYGMQELSLVNMEDHWAVRGAVNPTLTLGAKAKPVDPDILEAQKYLSTSVDLIDPTKQVFRGTVSEIEEQTKIVRIKVGGSTRMPGTRRIIVKSNLYYVSLADFLAAVRAKAPVPVKNLADLEHPSKFVINVNGKFLIAPEYRADWRARFYGPYSTKVKLDKLERLKNPYRGDPSTGLAHPDDIHLHVSNRRYWARNTYYNPRDGKRFEPTLDHDPAVVEDWNKEGGGHTTQQPQRKAFFSAGPFEVLPWFLNSSEGSGPGRERMCPEVGPDFRGPGEKFP